MLVKRPVFAREGGVFRGPEEDGDESLNFEVLQSEQDGLGCKLTDGSTRKRRV